MPFLRSRALRPTVAAVAAVLTAGALVAPAAPAAALTPARPAPIADPASWCRTVVPAAVDPEPLACWLSLTAPTGGQLPAGLAGMDLGDLPPGGDVDVDALAGELERYEAQARADAAAATVPPAPAPTRPEPTPVAPTPVGSRTDELKHRCLVLEVPGSCNALMDHLEATASGAPAPDWFDGFDPSELLDPLAACGLDDDGWFMTDEQARCLGFGSTAVEEDDPTEYELIEFDVEASTAFLEARKEWAKARIREVCGPRGGYSWDDFYTKDDFWIECD